MKSHLSNAWNNAVAYIEMRYQTHSLACGSAFFWNADGRAMLCTNWHNLSGRNPFTGQPMSSTGGIPNTVRVFLYQRVTDPGADGYFESDYVGVDVPLCDDDWRSARWFEHPIHGRKVDIAALDVTDVISGYEVAYVNEIESDAVLDLECSDDVFVLGFPFGQITGAPAPVWKRGSIALDPRFDPEGLPKLLVDTATREGMSGSVVLARRVILGRDYLRKDGTRAERVIIGFLTIVVGIYSGRHYPDLERAQLGIVWKRHAIEDLVRHRIVASV